jgi:hypothetical protein
MTLNRISNQFGKPNACLTDKNQTPKIVRLTNVVAEGALAL